MPHLLDLWPSQAETVSADTYFMEYEILSILSVIFFCLCCHQFIKTVVKPIPWMATERPYARVAMQFGKVYKGFAWATMTGAFLMGLIFSFQQVFQALN
jgi:hypothetical protein